MFGLFADKEKVYETAYMTGYAYNGRIIDEKARKSIKHRGIPEGNGTFTDGKAESWENGKIIMLDSKI